MEAYYELETAPARPAHAPCRSDGAPAGRCFPAAAGAAVAASIVSFALLDGAGGPRPAEAPPEPAPSRSAEAERGAPAVAALAPFSPRERPIAFLDEGLVRFPGTSGTGFESGAPAQPSSPVRSLAVPGLPARRFEHVEAEGLARVASLAGAAQLVDFDREMQALAPRPGAPRPDPLVLDLSGQGLFTKDRATRFDLEGDGRRGVLFDIASGAGVLVLDADGDGVSGSSGRELLGDRTDLDRDGKPDGFADGFEALEGLVRRAQARGVLAPEALERGRLARSDLAALGKAYGLGVRRGSLAAGTISCEDAGVRELVLSRDPSVRVPDFDGLGNDAALRAGAVFVRADGSVGAYRELFLAYNRARLRRLTARR
ncbi:MAG: hypothetical protein HY554_00560 [Elusimicrobia bacterium]|nr:hypothetical protein [Elusimicrobiota bacterium]